MKVIKKAVEREDLMKEVTCYCGALLGVTPGDLKADSDGDHYFRCPECSGCTHMRPWWRGEAARAR